MTTQALWLKHRPLASKLALNFHIPGFDLDDVRQEALIALWQASRSYDPSLGANFPTWARRVICARLTDVLRQETREKRHARTERLHDNVPAPDPGRQLAELVELLPELTQLERDAISSRLDGSYSSYNRRQENALQSAKRKWKAA